MSSSAPDSSSRYQSMFVGASPASTAGHHASVVTLGAGIFASRKNGHHEEREAEFDPERSLGRLVDELGRVMGNDKLPSRPSSPFSPTRTPTPLGSNPLDLSFTLARSTPLPSPPPSEGEPEISETPKPRPRHPRRTSAHASNNEKTAKGNRPLGESRQGNMATNLGATRAFQPTSASKDRLRSLRAQHSKPRSVSAPVRSDRTLGDVTGLTDLFDTPSKPGEFGWLGKDESVGGIPAADIPATLEKLNQRLKALDIENSASRRRVRELEEELARAKEELAETLNTGKRDLAEVRKQKAALEELVTSTRKHLSLLTLELESQKSFVAKLKSTPVPASAHSLTTSAHLSSLRTEIDKLSKKISALHSIVEQGLEARKRGRGEPTLQMEREEMERIMRQIARETRYDSDHHVENGAKDGQSQQKETQQSSPRPSKLSQGLHAAASSIDSLLPSTQQKPSFSFHKAYDPSDNLTYSPTPTATAHSGQPSSVQSKPDSDPSLKKKTSQKNKEYAQEKKPEQTSGQNGSHNIFEEDLNHHFFTFDKGNEHPEDKKEAKQQPQETKGKSKLQRVLDELVTDFAQLKLVYADLADRYKELDPASDVVQRHKIANRLKEVIKVLEKKADQIDDLKSLL
ncbi:conserved hypothetical protein [Cryptococcus gattii WM276]|uniref:Cep57 centrosome microtubule-binding domain-containing protein n=1 Tax=Cryptococcus gattii serotype B (strain WM276 / ATCC MYA-4071) TaxID=367775 RepID=E6RC07_CRYGW|nr:uncharacterized protein CGB_I2060C [Cryptococcus gattii WM276]ADV24394.1 conserved hypothetical protein [Cryptococcus gattii WM276]